MGSDIHLHVETRFKGWGNENWIHSAFGEFSKRNYDLFARIGNICNYHGFEHLEIRGLPEDVSVDTKRAYEEYGKDAESPNWCTPEELERYCNDDSEWWALLQYMKALEKNGDFEVRAVFWFN